MKKFFKIASFLFLLVSFIGCKPEVKVKPKTGSIQGKVVYENENVTDYSGIQVTLFSTNGLMATDYCVSRGIATNARSVESVGITNAAGEYFFENVPEGVYTIYASSNSSTKKAVATNVVVRAAETVTAEILGLTATGSISGKITIDYLTDDVLGLDVFIAGTSFIAKVGNDGNYEISNIPAKRGYVLCVQKGDFTAIINSYLEVKANTSVKIQTANLLSIYWEEDTSVQENPTFKWLGAFASTPNNPNLYEAYFNTTDGCSYIWNGSGWDLLAKAGKDGEDGNDGVSINWRGNYSDSSYIYEPQYLDAYFNTTDGCSYIWNGYSWELLVQKGADGTDGISINWLGSYSDSSYIYDPQYLDAYFNTTDGCSYIYTDYGWSLLAQKGDDGIDGKSFNWIGSYTDSNEIFAPQYLDVYFNVTDGCSYIYTNYGWTLLAQKGDDGFDGNGINWRGHYAYAEEIYEPQYLDVYFNTTDGCSYIYNNYGWDLFVGKGYINWLGSYYSSDGIYSPQYMDAYFNTTDGCSYIYTNNGWTLLAQKGDNGIDGKGINWLGSYYSSDEIYSPQYMDAYFNITDGCSYIWTNYGWTLLAQKGDNGDNGIDGKGINWLGNYAYAYEIDNPQYLDAYFNTTDGCSYIYTYYGWTLFAQKGADGTDGISINWLGNYSASYHIDNPQYLDAYFNTTDGCSYIYTYNGWELLVQKGTDGKGINWLGSYSGSYHIDNPQYLDAYFNTLDGCSYIYTYYGWTMLAQKGETGAGGIDGKGINWLGSYSDSSYIDNPQYLDAYFNTTDGCSYIYSNKGWELLVQKGEAGSDGVSITWKGSLENAPENPELNWAYYNINTGCSYIWNGSCWDLLTQHANHIFSEWTVVTAPTCETEGKEERTCTICLYKEEQSIPATVHSYGAYVSNNDATTDSDGTKTRTCEVCGYKDTVVDEGSKILNGIIGIPTGLLQGETYSSGITMDGTTYSKTSEVVVVPEGTDAYVFMIDDSSWSSYFNNPSDFDMGVFFARRKVKLSPFVMSQYEVTQELYNAVIGSNPSNFTNNSVTGETQKYRPVEKVSWYDALVFCNKLSMKLGLTPCYTINENTNPDEWGLVPTTDNEAWNSAECNLEANGYRLPTEAEWEYAARGGDSTKAEWKYAYSGSQTEKDPLDFQRLPGTDDALEEYGWYLYNSGDVTHEVGKKLPNTLGLFDMSGNVSEMCWDWLSTIPVLLSSDKMYVNEKGVVENPKGDTTSMGYFRVGRGGNWTDSSDECSVSDRGGYSCPYSRSFYIGFRVVRSCSK